MARGTGPNPQDFNDANDAADSLFAKMQNIARNLTQQAQLHASIKTTNAGMTTQLQAQLALYNQINAALQQQLALHQQIAAATGGIAGSMGSYSAQATQAANSTGTLTNGIQQAASTAGTLSNNMAGTASRTGGLSGLFSKAGGALKGLGGMAKNLGATFSKMLGPVGMIVSFLQEHLVDAFKMIDDASGDTAKNLGVSYNDAVGMSKRMNEAAINSGELFANTENMMAAQNSLNEMLGTSVEFSGQFAAEYASIKELTGLSDKAMGRFAQMSLMSGKGLKQTMNAVNNEITKINRAGLSRKAIEESIGKASNATLLTLKNNPKALAGAAYEAKKLGLEIEDINKIGQSMLDFESSIASELEAELLTGKDLNLEKARYAALTGDTATLAKEVSRQVGTSAEFGKMNVIQQEALAKSFGMNRDQLADMLVQEETLKSVRKMGFEDLDSAQKAYNEDVAKGLSQKELEARYADEGLRNQLASASIQERMEASSKKLKELFVQIVEQLMPILDTLTNIYTGAIQPIVKIVSRLISLFFDLFKKALAPMLPVIEQVKQIFTDIFGEAAATFDIVGMIGDYLGVVLTNIMEPLKISWEFVANLLSGIFDVVGGIVKLFKGDFMGGIKQIGTGLLKGILSPFQLVANIIEGIVNMAIRVANLFGGDLKEVDFDFTSGIGKEEKIQPKTKLANGGITKGPTNALIGEAGQEAVIPLNQLMAKFDAMADAIKQGGNITINLDGVKVGTALKSGRAGYSLQ